MSVKISELQSSSTLDGTEQIPLVQNGTTKKVSVSNLGFPFTGTASIDGALNIDFTETLDFVMESDASLYGGENYFGPMAGWVPLNSIGDIIAQKLENSDILIHNGVFDMEFDPGSGPLPVVSAGQVLEVITGSYSGSVFTNSVVKSPGGYGSAEMALRVKEGADNRQYAFETGAELVDGSNDGLTIRKINESGEIVELDLNNNESGFILENTLSDPFASLFKFIDDSSDTIFEVRNDGLFVGPNIPTADPLVLGQIWSDNGVLTISAGTP